VPALADSLLTRGLRAVGLAAPADEPQKPALGLPGGLTVERWLKDATAAKGGEAYDSAIGTAALMYRGQMVADTTAALRRAFPTSWSKIHPLSLPAFQRVSVATATVFAGSPRHELVGDDGEALPADDARTKRWDDALAGAQIQAVEQEADRQTVGVRRVFAREAWDPDRGCLRIDLFTPDKVFPRFALDSFSLDRAEGVLLEVAPVQKGDKTVRRFEFWSAGEHPRNFWIDETNEITTPAGNPEGLNQIVDDEGSPVVPIVAFADTAPGSAYWAMPDESLVSGQRAINVALSNLRHVEMMQGHGQWVAQIADASKNPDPWIGSSPVPVGASRAERRAAQESAETLVQFGPDKILTVPKGWALDHKAQSAPLADLRQGVVDLLSNYCALRGLPVRTLIPSAPQTSGVALVQEREPLEQIRRDRVAFLREAADRLLNVARWVFNANQKDNATRILGVRCRFVPDKTRPVMDEETASRLEKADLASRLTSRAHILAKREGLPLEKAIARVQEIDDAAKAAGDDVLMQAQNAGLGRLLTGAKATPPPSDGAQTQTPAPADGATTDAKAAEGAKQVAATGVAVADTALNGAQVTALAALVKDVANGAMPRDAAVAIIENAFVVPRDRAEKMMGAAGKGFTPAPPQETP
jgi:hypothetical protein